MVGKDTFDAGGPLVVALSPLVVVKPDPATSEVADLSSCLRVAGLDGRLSFIRQYLCHSHKGVMPTSAVHFSPSAAVIVSEILLISL